jgi:hypothetical protein
VPPAKRFLLWFVALVAWLGLLVATHLPVREARALVGDLQENGNDKPLHLASYFVAALLTATALAASIRWTFLVALTLAAALALLAAVDEWTQPLVGRTCDPFDWLADAIGIGLAVVLVSVIVRWRQSSRGNGEGPR